LLHIIKLFLNLKYINKPQKKLKIKST